MSQTLKYLHFDASEDSAGLASFEAMASVGAAQWPALQAEVAAVLDWAHHGYAGVRGPLEEDGDWDYDLHATQESVCTLALDFDPELRRLSGRTLDDGMPRYTLTLTLGGTPGFAEALRARFDMDAD